VGFAALFIKKVSSGAIEWRRANQGESFPGRGRCTKKKLKLKIQTKVGFDHRKNGDRVLKVVRMRGFVVI